VAYQFAAFLVRDLGLADAVALDWLQRWDAGNRPPKGAEALAEILANARLYGRHAIGSALPDCDSPIFFRGNSHHGTISFRLEVD
jgi:hypothetical protein